MRARRKAISSITKLHLWTKSAGRCQFKGCNDNLLKDELTYAELNKSNIAHIIDVNKKTHRYTDNYTEEQKNELWNLMLLCPTHHRLIDNEEEKKYTVEILQRYKREHENRILNLTSIKGNVKTEVICFMSKVGRFLPKISLEEIKEELSKKDLYLLSEPIEIGMKNSTLEDNEEIHWIVEEKNLIKDFEQKVLKKLTSSERNHFSLFAFAPQPLLIKFGTLIPDIYTVDVYQKHREPDTWGWQNNKGDFSQYTIKEPINKGGIPVLNISLSADISNDRITTLFKENVSIWTLTIDSPSNNFLIHPDILLEFRLKIRFILNKIKLEHGHDSTLKVFPCMPNSACVEFGRVWMPKADLTLEIYDERNGFKKAITINRE
ncbi:MAG: SAVED domain-containing protein [Flavobacteriales bacterium]|jgi:hypothetical protein|nr:SAVED domain-containing protein [Flavobacteriales bacterium]